ncbi:MAG: hypothetical protein QNI84_11845 [Henriciella sp.]|nr:hypothetical protein [Henriciella sp.]
MAIQFANSNETVRFAGLMGALCLIGVAACDTFGNTAPDQSASWIPRWMLETPENEPEVLPAQAMTSVQPAATFIVRFRDEPALEDVCKSFRRDYNGAQAKYQAWASGRPALAGLYLSSASYSGELILALPQNDPYNRSPQDVLTALRGLNNLAYAELDSNAYANAGGNPK